MAIFAFLAVVFIGAAELGTVWAGAPPASYDEDGQVHMMDGTDPIPPPPPPP